MAIQINLASSFQKYEFCNGDDVFASFEMNPADVKLINRLQEVGDFFDNIGKQAGSSVSIGDAIKLNNEIEEKFCYILGYDVKAPLFGRVSATSAMEDGDLFAAHILRAIKEYALPEIEKRNKAMAAAVANHTAKYE